jgi:DNA-binding response OmpR family regulator
MPTKVLLVDTHRQSRETIAEFLRKNNFAVTDVTTASEAAAELHQRRFDLLIYYTVGLHKLDRLKMAFALRTSNPATPVIIISDRPRFNPDEGLFRGATEILTAPVDLDTLVYAAIFISSVLCRKRRGQQTWHACTNCRDWPEIEYEECLVNPYDGLELCNECRIKLRHSNCHR